MLAKKWLVFGVVFAFLVMGFLSMKRAMPEHKEMHIYKEIKLYSPYYFEKTIGGLAIIDKRDDFKEKPSAADVMHRMDELDKNWGKKHLRVEKSDLVIMGDNNQTVVKIFIKTPEERAFLTEFYGI